MNQKVDDSESSLAKVAKTKKTVELYDYDPQGHISKVRKWHSNNFDSVKAAVEQAKKHLTDAIAQSGESSSDVTSSEESFTRLYSMLMGIWIEARLHVLIYEVGAFSEAERAFIYKEDGLDLKWQTALEAAIKKKFAIPLDSIITEENTSFSHFKIYQQIKNWIELYFRNTIHLRNKIAHGQWVEPFVSDKVKWENSSFFKINTETKNNFRTENDNLLTISEREKLLSTICVAINNLAVDPGKFLAQDFDQHYDIISKHIKKLQTIDYEDYKTRARLHFQKNIKTA